MKPEPFSLKTIIKKLKKRKYDKQYYIKNRERILKRQAEYRKRNREKLRQKAKEYYLKHKEECIARSHRSKKSREWIKTEKGKLFLRRYYLEHKEEWRIRSLTQYYLAKTKKQCIICGSRENLEFHHLSYDNPMNVIVLCRSCHRKLHKGEIKWEVKKNL